MKRILVIAALVAIVLFFALGFDRYLTLEAVKGQLEELRAWQQSAPWVVAASFVGFYAAVAALSLPGALLLTLTAGALFGLVWGTVLASLASSVGALGAFLASRYLFRDAVQKRFGDRLKTLDKGVAKDGAFYLFTLRLVPLLPFFVINLLMGLTSIRALTFYLVSQLGMLAGTVVYVNAGRQLSNIDSLAGIFSPGLIGSFALLGIFPLLARWVVAFWRKRRVYSRWRKPVQFDRNLIVIGAGAAGLVTSYIAAAVKARVTLVEAHKMGGDCLNFGCVPSKALIRSATLAHQMRHASRYGLKDQPPQFSFRRVAGRIQEVIRDIAPHDSIERYSALGVEVLQGYARIVDPWTVEITSAQGDVHRLTTRAIVIASGAQPVVPPLPGIETSGYLTSDTLWNWLAQQDEAPERVIVLGGGPIGTELSQALVRLGSGVTQVESNDRLLKREDEEVSRLVAESLTKDGVRLLTRTVALRCEQDKSGSALIVQREGIEERIAYDVLLCAVGRAPRLTGFGLEQLGIPVSRTIEANDYLETLYPNILAAGDVAGPYQFTHVAGHQAWYAAVNALFGHLKRLKVDYRVIPWATFCDPEVARVGLNEQEAKEQGIAVEVTRFGIDDLDRAIADSANHGFVKVLTVPGKDRILGVTIVGERAADLLSEFVLAMKWKLGLNRILSTIHTYPTLAEANKYVAGEWKRAHAPQLLLRWLGRYHRWRRGWHSG